MFPLPAAARWYFRVDILVGDLDGIVVIRSKDALEIAQVAQKKKASEDQTFA